MHSGPPRSTVIVFAVLASLAFCVSDAPAQQPPAIEVAFPSQLVRGEANIIHVAIPSPEMFTGAEVSPSAGITVSRVVNVKPAQLSQNVAWWEITVDVAMNAMPGARSLVLVTPSGRSTAAPMVVAGHVPVVSGIKAASSADKSMADVEFAATDESGDLGDQPYVWFTITCGGEPTVGVVRGRRAGSVVRASIPRPASNPCDLELRASDAQKFDSNTLKARVP